MGVEQHKDISLLVADIRNKLGAPYNFFALLTERNKKGQPKEMIQLINKLLKKNEGVAIESMKKLVDLLDQFENYNLDNIKPNTKK